MCEDRSSENHYSRLYATIYVEMPDAVVITHKDSKEEVPRDRKKSSGNTDTNPRTILQAPKQVHHVFHSSKAHAHANRIHYPIKVLIEIRILAQQKPQQRKLSHLLRNGSKRKGITESIQDRRVLLRANTRSKHRSRSSKNKTKQNRKHTITESPDEPLSRLWLRAILFDDIPQQHRNRRNSRKNNQRKLHNKSINF